MLFAALPLADKTSGDVEIAGKDRLAHALALTDSGNLSWREFLHFVRHEASKSRIVLASIAVHQCRSAET